VVWGASLHEADGQGGSASHDREEAQGFRSLEKWRPEMYGLEAKEASLKKFGIFHKRNSIYNL
jgi:hypothetical protein